MNNKIYLFSKILKIFNFLVKILELNLLTFHKLNIEDLDFRIV